MPSQSRRVAIDGVAGRGADAYFDGMASVAEVIVATLRAAGVRRIYGVVGQSLNDLIDVVRKSEEIANPDFAAVARAMGMHWARVTDPELVEPALRDALARDDPALVDVVVHRQELAMPPTVTAEQARGFSLYALKAVLSGRGDAVVDLAVTNLWR